MTKANIFNTTEDNYEILYENKVCYLDLFIPVLEVINKTSNHTMQEDKICEIFFDDFEFKKYSKITIKEEVKFTILYLINLGYILKDDDGRIRIKFKAMELVKKYNREINKILISENLNKNEQIDEVKRQFQKDFNYEIIRYYRIPSTLYYYWDVLDYIKNENTTDKLYKELATTILSDRTDYSSKVMNLVVVSSREGLIYWKIYIALKNLTEDRMIKKVPNKREYKITQKGIKELESLTKPLKNKKDKLIL